MRTRHPCSIIDHDRSATDRRTIRRQRRAAKRRDRHQAGGGSGRSGVIVFTDPLRPERLASQADNVSLRLLAAVSAASLDRQLASGVPPETNRLLAVRAERLVSPTMRGALAQRWADLLEQARRPPSMRDPRAPICRDRIMDTGRDVEALLDALSAPVPVGARGVALAARLLCDGAGPVYHRQSHSDLRSALHEATAHLAAVSFAELS